MQDEDLSVEWRWVAETSSEEDAEKIEEAWEREQMKVWKEACLSRSLVVD